MGIIAAIGSAAAVAKAISTVKDTLSGLDPKRAVVIEVHNRTDRPLKLASHSHTHGAFGELPSDEIPPQSVDVFGSKDTSISHGTEGLITYESEDGYLLRTRWNNPISGSTSCDAIVLGTNSGQFEALELCGDGAISNVRFSVQPGATARPIVRKGSATAGSVADIAALAISNRMLVTAVRAGNGALKLISWATLENGLGFQRVSDSGSQAGQASDLDIALGNLLIVACRADNGNLLLTSWSTQNGQFVRRGDSRDSAGKDRAGEGRAISLIALSSTIFLTAIRSGAGNLLLITWRLDASGELIRLGDSGNQAGTCTEIAALKVSNSAAGQFRAVTAVRGGDGKLRLISWLIAEAGTTIARLSFIEGQAGNADLIRIVNIDEGKIVTSLRSGGGNLLLISWAIDANGSFARLADTHGQAGSISSNAIIRSDGGVITAVAASNGLKLIRWSVSDQGAIRRLSDSGDQAGAASLIALCGQRFATPAPMTTVLRNGSGNLMLIGWTDL